MIPLSPRRTTGCVASAGRGGSEVEALRRARRNTGLNEATDHPDAEAASSTLVRRLTQ